MCDFVQNICRKCVLKWGNLKNKRNPLGSMQMITDEKAKVCIFEQSGVRSDYLQTRTGYC